MKVVLAFDIGSSSVRCSAYDLEANFIEDTLVKHTTHLEPNGTADVKMYLKAVDDAADSCLDILRKKYKQFEVVAVGADSFAMTIVGLDEHGEPITPIYTYANRLSMKAARKLSDELEKKNRLEETHQKTGVVIHSCYAPSLFYYLQNEEKELLGKVKHWTTVYGVCLRKWFDLKRPPISSSEASWTGMMNRFSLEWYEGLFEELKDLKKETLSEIQDFSQYKQGLVKEFSEKWPELQNSRFYLALGDGAAANVGTGCLTPKRICLTIGTSAAIRITIPAPYEGEIPEGLWCYRIDKSRAIIGGALTDGGRLYDWTTKVFRDIPENRDEAQKELEKTPPRPHEMNILPFLGPERSPGYSHLPFVLTGISYDTRGIDVLRAGLEGVAFRLANIFRRAQPIAAKDATIVVTGAAATGNKEWRRIIATCFGQPLELQKVSEATSLGVARLIIENLRHMKLGDMNPEAFSDHTDPVQEWVEVYKKGMKMQEDLYALLEEEFEVRKK